ncbi:hypothetical protein Tco_0923932 [Tanacetum coccineum]|uniref:Peptidase A2 domain-containing protein n=1 Tax=Tanacetum coccineum TaxID=301880 RepID=A0ABQ5D4P0_9ASTR
MLRGLNQLMERKECGCMYLLYVSLIGDVRTLMIDKAHASRYLVNSGADKTYYDLRDMYGGYVWRRILLPITLVWASEVVSSGFPIVKVRQDSKRGPKFTWEREDHMKANYACSDSLLLTPLCCDDIHDVTPRVSTLAGCDSFGGRGGRGGSMSMTPGTGRGGVKKMSSTDSRLIVKGDDCLDGWVGARGGVVSNGGVVFRVA